MGAYRDRSKSEARRGALIDPATSTGPAARLKGGVWARRTGLWTTAALLGLVLWLSFGLRSLETSREVGVLDGPIPGLPRVVTGRVLAPPGLLRLYVYPCETVELPLPGAEALDLGAPDGTRFGLKGTARVRLRSGEALRLHASSRGRGIRAALLAACGAAARELPPTILTRDGVTLLLSRRLEIGLRQSLEERGLDLATLHLEGLDFLSDRAPARAPAPDTRLLVVGLDGADWAIIDPLMAQGRMPHLERLVARGVRAKLLSVAPMISPVVWTTIATGVAPLRHGILDFLAPRHGAEAEGEPVTSRERRVPAVWEMLSSRGIRVGVVGWWATWPVDPVEGYMVSDRIAYQLFGFRSDLDDAKGKAWPPDLFDRIRADVVPPESVQGEEVRRFLAGSDPMTGDPLLRDLQTVLASGETYLRIAQTARKSSAPRLEMVFFEGTDTVAHLFMPYRAPIRPGVDLKRFESYREVVDRYYERVDGYLGALLEGRGDDWTVMVLSDHGFATDETRPTASDSRIGHGPAADWHRKFGILVLSGASVRKGGRLEEAGVYDIAPTILALFGVPVPRAWPGRPLGQALEREFLESHPVRLAVEEDRRRGDRNLGLEAEQGGPQSGELREKLRSLGYIGGGEEGTGKAVSSRNNAGVALLAAGRYRAAEQEFREALRESPDLAVVQSNLGIALRMQGRSEEARDWLSKAMSAREVRRTAGLELAQIEMGAGDWSAAEATLNRVLETEPNAWEAHQALARIHELRGDRDAARSEYERAVAADPDAAEPRNGLAGLLRQLGRDSEAEHWYLEAMKADPGFMGTYNNLALLYQDRGEYGRAITMYERALARSPDDAVVLNNLASLHYAMGESEEAQVLWEQAVAADPRYPSPLNNLAGLRIAKGDLQGAEDLLLRALTLDPRYGDARLNLAIVEHSRGRLEEARTQLLRAADDPRARLLALTQLARLALEMGRPADALQAVREAVELEVSPREDLRILEEEALRRLGGSPNAPRGFDSHRSPAHVLT